MGVPFRVRPWCSTAEWVRLDGVGVRLASEMAGWDRGRTPSAGEGELPRVGLGRQGPSSWGADCETSTLQRGEGVAEAGVVDPKFAA